MPIHNAEIAAIFDEVADLLDIQDANRFRVRAYREAARTVRDLSRSVAEMIEEGEDLTALPGIGKDLAGKIHEIVATGRLTKLDSLRKEMSPQVADLLRVPGLGPRKAAALYRELGVASLDDLRRAVDGKKVRGLDGFGAKSEEKIGEALERLVGAERRIRLALAEELAEPLKRYLAAIDGVKQVAIAGSYRRRRETVGDLDILVSHRQGAAVMERFVAYDDVATVVSQGETRSTVILRSGLQVDLRVVAAASYGAALHYFTGSKAHNIAVRRIGVRKGYKINEYGVFEGDRRIAGRTEEEVYRSVDLPYIEPELRENQGELEAAAEGRLPRLIERRDIRGDLHTHTSRTDGHADLGEMAKAAKRLGYDYLAITEHTKQVRVAGGLDAEALARHLEAIDEVNDSLDDIVLLKGAEVDILVDGSLDLPDAVLAKLDLTVCSVHSKFGLSREKQTERLVRAMDNPYFHILGHPTGRLLGSREPYEVDMERLMAAAAERGCFLELNAQPERLDLTDVHAKTAKEMGIKIAISSDAHSIDNLEYMRFGIWQARRGWLEAGDVLNTRSLAELRRLLKR